MANSFTARISPVLRSFFDDLIERTVQGLLNKLTTECFDSISDQIITLVNKSEKEKDGRTLIKVIRLVFEKATDEATWSEMYARLCRKMMEQISANVQDDWIKNSEGKPMAGGQLFRKYLLNRCQEDFERGWVAKEATAAAAATKASQDQAAKAAVEESKDGESALYSEEYYAAQKAKRQGLGLIKFIGELFKLQMLTERIMHECVKKLLGNAENPEEEEIESVCKLLTTVGQILDTPKARAHMDVYFSRMKALCKSPNVNSRVQFVLQDIIELRERKWVPRNQVAAPTTIAAVHEAAAKEKAANEKDAYQRDRSMSGGGLRRGGERGEHARTGPDGWATIGSSAPRPPPKAGDLSNFGKISKTASMTFAIRRKFDLLPRTAFTSDEAQAGATPALSMMNSDDEEWEVASPLMTHAEAEAQIGEDSEEFFILRNINEAEVYFTKLPVYHRWRLVDKLVMFAIESEEADAQFVAKSFELAASRDLCSPASFEQGFQQVAGILDDIAIDAPMAFNLMATMMKGARLDEERSSRLASRSMHSDRLLSLLTSDVPQSRIESPSSSRSTSVTDCQDSITASPQQNVFIPPISDSDAYTLVCDAATELFSILDLRAEAYFTRLPVDYHWCLVDKLVWAAIANEFDAQLVAGLFDRAAARRLCSPASFEGGFAPVMQALDNTASNAPRIFERMAIMMKSARLDEERNVRLASRSKDGDELLSWLCFHVALSSMRSRSSSSRTSSANAGKVSPPQNESSPHTSDSEAYAMVCDNAQELLSLFDLRADTYFTRLPVDYHWCLVDKLVSAAIANESDAQLVAGLFDRAAARRLCSPASFEAGFAPIAQALEHITIGAPNALECIAIMMKGAHIHEDNERCIRLANRSRRGSMLLSLLSV